ncbi:MAG: hypothetical protein HDR51_08045 [Treponema sp.]|nr:hypothetical protein [Treponema sp.]
MNELKEIAERLNGYHEDFYFEIMSAMKQTGARILSVRKREVKNESDE